MARRVSPRGVEAPKRDESARTRRITYNRAADGWAPRLDAIPTAIDKSIADPRSKHRHDEFQAPDDEPRDEGDRRTEGGPPG